ncbi:hypothetical protein B0T19DRAFT_420238 [Cercophora scortea]|uniref:Uncharacterized protein n=1 Tax=Cercophora scortea TaxID=314031 RepID=A0AAE0IZN2_9PEZI|nr:hypothetical protein B0T19DRAFT_420238 [Cercophora scortea]
MPLRQHTFTLVPNPLGMQGLLNRPAHELPPAILPAMTSKQAKKAYKEKNKVPRMSKAEQLRIEREEQARIKKELEKEKAARKARAARDKKKAKEQAEAEEKRRKRLPLVSVHPSQDTISRFFRGNAFGAKRDSTGNTVGKEEVTDNQRDEENQGEDCTNEGNHIEEHEEKNVNEEPAVLEVEEPVQSQRKRRRLSQENLDPPVSQIRGGGTPKPRALSVIHEDQENEPSSGDDMPSERQRIIPRSPDMVKASPRLAMPPPSSASMQAFRKSRLEKPQAPRNAPPRSSQTRNSETTVLPPKSPLPRMPLQEISENRPRQIANLTKADKIASSCKPRRSTPVPASLRPADTFPTSTQLFVMSHLDDFPTPSQAAQELEEEFPVTRPTTPAEEAQSFVMEHLDEFPTPSQEARELQEETALPTAAAKVASTQLLMMSHWDDWLPTPSQEARELKEYKPAVAPSLKTNSAPRPGTQLFIESNLNDFFPTPTQEARELAEEFPSAPATALPDKPRRIQATASKSAPGLGKLTRKVSQRPAFLPKHPRLGVLKATSTPFLSTQDWVFSSQDIRDLERTTETPSKSTNIPVAKGVPVSSSGARRDGDSPCKTIGTPVAEGALLTPDGQLETASSLGKTPRTPVAKPDPPLPSAEQQPLETAASPGKTTGIPVAKADVCVSTAERQLEEDLSVVEDLLKSQGPPFNVPRDPNASPQPLRFLGSHGLRLELLIAVQESRQTFQEQEREQLREEEKQCEIQVEQGTKQMEILSDPSETDYFDNDLDEVLLRDLMGF